MDTLVTVISTFVYLTLSIITVFLGSSNDKQILQKRRFIVFLLLSLIYCSFIIYEKFQSVEREKELQSLIVSKQNDTNYKLMHLSMASLDLSTPTRYQKYPNFRLGLMWYWLGSHNEATYHFRAHLRKHPKHIPSKYNLAILLVLKQKKSEAIELLSSIPRNSLSSNKKRLIEQWLKMLSENKLQIVDSEQWVMWRLP